MDMTCKVPFRPIDELESDLIDCCRRRNAYEYEFLVLLREYDLRQGWREWGCTDCASWMNLRCGILPASARERLRTARALIDLPLISAAFEQGYLSYSKVRALTRIATPKNEEELLHLCKDATASQVESWCAQMRNGQREASTGDAEGVYRNRYLSRRYNSDGSVSISVELPRELGDLVMKAIEHAVGEETATVDETIFARQADGLVNVARSYLSGEGTGATSENYQVMVHVDERALRDEGGKSDLPIESVRRLLCDCSVVPVLEDGDGIPLDVGRKKRTLCTALKRALESRDEECCFPGCTNKTWTESHHVINWVDGGETTLDNLMTLCSKHHRMVHEGGFEIRKDYRGAWYFRRPDGTPIMAGSVCERSRISAETSRVEEPLCETYRISAETFAVEYSDP